MVYAIAIIAAVQTGVIRDSKRFRSKRPPAEGATRTHISQTREQTNETHRTRTLRPSQPNANRLQVGHVTNHQ